MTSGAAHERTTSAGTGNERGRPGQAEAMSPYGSPMRPHGSAIPPHDSAMSAHDSPTPPNGHVLPPKGGAMTPNGSAMTPDGSTMPPDASAMQAVGDTAPVARDAARADGNAPCADSHAEAADGDARQAARDEGSAPQATRHAMPSEGDPLAGERDPMLRKIVDALEAIRAEEFDYEILRAASDVMGQDVVTTWRPSLGYLPPEERDGEYHVTVYAQGACESCPIKKSHVGSIEPKVRELVGADNVFVHDYFDWFDGQTTQMFGE